MSNPNKVAGATRHEKETERQSELTGPNVNECGLFLRSLEFDDENERKRFLDEACGGDRELFEGVRRLLDEHENNSVCVIDEPLFGPNQIESISFGQLKSGIRIGPYRLESSLGEGGMGAVWLARQSEPVRRRVALKLIRPGDQTPGILQRFEAERQALAALDHPHIAKVLDVGATEIGRPYFVMEWVDGTPLTQFCDESKMTIRQRLELFVQVAQAVQHAHYKGILHRDLKPSNILATSVDGRPIAKIIDFGLAKALGGRLTKDSLTTQFGVVVGTLEFMAPEQAGYHGQDIDTRADIYSLGVILYELLTGSRPFDAHRIRHASLDEVLRMIKEEEPVRPSTRLSSSDGAASFADQRQTEAKKLSSLLRNELDWIVLKALEKDRNRRYETANDLAADIQRYLSGEPVLAHPPSKIYRLQKFIRKHQRLVASLAAVFAVLLLGICGTTYGLFKSSQYARVAQKEKADADTARILAQQAAKEEHRQRRYAEAIADFVEHDFLALTSVEGQLRFDDLSGLALGKDATLRQLLDRAAEKLDERDDVEPQIAAKLCWIIGVNYRSIGELALAIPFLEQCVAIRNEVFGTSHEDTISAQHSLAVAYTQHGDLEKAFALSNNTFAQSRNHLGEIHSITMASMSLMASIDSKNGEFDKAIALFEKTLTLQKLKLGQNHWNTFETKIGLGNAYVAVRDLDKAMPLLKDTLDRCTTEFGENHPLTIVCMTDLARGHAAAGNSQKAIELLNRCLELSRTLLGEDHHNTIVLLNELGVEYQKAGQFQIALPLLEQSLALKQGKAVDNDHASILRTMNNLGVVYSQSGLLDKALPLLEETVTLSKAKLGESHRGTLNAINSLASGYCEAGQRDKALPLLEQALPNMKIELGEDHSTTLNATANLASIYAKTGQLDRAIQLGECVMRSRERVNGRNHAQTLITIGNLAVHYYDDGRLDEAIPLLEEVYRSRDKHPWLPRYSDILLQAYVKTKRTDQVIPLVDQLMVDARKTHAAEPLKLAGRMGVIGLDLLKLAEFEKAEKLLRECWNIRQEHDADNWTTFNAQSMLGGALSGQEKYKKAEPLLVAGYEGMQQRSDKIPSAAKRRLDEALDRLINLATVSGDSESLGRWLLEKNGK